MGFCSCIPPKKLYLLVVSLSACLRPARLCCHHSVSLPCYLLPQRLHHTAPQGGYALCGSVLCPLEPLLLHVRHISQVVVQSAVKVGVAVASRPLRLLCRMGWCPPRSASSRPTRGSVPTCWASWPDKWVCFLEGFYHGPMQQAGPMHASHTVTHPTHLLCLRDCDPCRTI
jgi:hypothetical protein